MPFAEQDDLLRQQRGFAFQHRDEMSDTSAKIGVERHRRDADGEAGCRGHEGLRNAAGQQHRPHRTRLRRDMPERIEDANDGTEQAEHGRKHADIHDVEHALVQRCGDAIALRLRHDLDRVGVGVRMALEKAEDAIDDPRRSLRPLGDIGRESIEVLVLEERLHALEQVGRRDRLFSVSVKKQ